MPNQNETMCSCMGIYNETTGACDDPQGVDPCPQGSNGNGNGFWQTAAGWDWNNISNTALTWGYATGLLTPPNSQNLTTQAYMMELQRQRQQMMMIMVGLGVLMLVVVIMVIRKK